MDGALQYTGTERGLGLEREENGLRHSVSLIMKVRCASSKCKKEPKGYTKNYMMRHYWCLEHYEKEGKYPDYYVKRYVKKLYLIVK